MMSSFFILIVIVSFIMVQGSSPACPSTPEVKLLEDPDDCAVFHFCFSGQRLTFSCEQRVWNAITNSCVEQGTTKDRFKQRVNGCFNKVAKIAKGDNCAQYYDCSLNASNMVDRKRECPYPFLFDAQSATCRDHSEVKCGERKEPKDPCDYDVNMCQSAMCLPCIERFPSCTGLPDGLNPWIGREGSPYYVVCRGERVVYSGHCGSLLGLQMFDATKKSCVLNFAPLLDHQVKVHP
ncbi:uncharacterized protein [Haliotis cracherodii]|uniref:uncharacterized protein n=1 Tax=Haliotis cracherodii TaxID=6455 RepID=UPI0039ED8541